MNLSQLINRIKLDLGEYARSLPVKNIDDTIATVVKDVTLLTFSILHPKMDTMAVDLQMLRCTEKNREYQEFIISGRNNTGVAFVEDVRPDSSIMSGWTGYNPAFTSDLIYQHIIGNASTTLSNQMLPRMTFDFQWPNKLKIYNLLTNRVVIDYGQMHDLTLASVSPTASESFYKLAVLDVKATLYNIVKHYNEIQTAHGRIELKLDDWADAASKREELVNSWEEVAHLDQKTIYWI